MKRNGQKIMKWFLAMFLVCGLFSGCSSKEWTVTLMNGETQLGTITAKDGKTLDPTSVEAFQNQPDTEFLGWYETPTFLESSKKDLATLTITSDLTLYGSFKSTIVAEDTRAWYLAGTSEGGPLKDNVWAGGAVSEEVRETFRLVATGNAVNEYSITIDLFAGDQFQVIPNWSWDGQKGFGCVTSSDETQVVSGGGLSSDTSKSNINVVMDGNYTITLTTNPDEPVYDTFTIVRNGDPLGGKSIYVASEATGIMVKGSWVDDWSDVKECARTTGNVFTITLDLEAETQLCFMVYDNGVDTGLVLKEEHVTTESKALLMENGYNIQVLEKGSYTFTVDADAMSVAVTK